MRRLFIDIVQLEGGFVVKADDQYCPEATGWGSSQWVDWLKKIASSFLVGGSQLLKL